MAHYSPLSWTGGKSKLVPKLLELLPAHHIYVEVFGGGAALLFAKEPSPIEIYNDIDGALVAFFTALRDNPGPLAQALALTLYSREEYQAACETVKRVRGGEDHPDAARALFVSAHQAYCGWIGHGWQACSRVTRRHPTVLANAVRRLGSYALRLQGVYIEHLDWRELLTKWAKPHAALYCDPPYPGTVQKSYASAFSRDDLAELVERLAQSPARAMVSAPAEFSALFKRDRWQCHRVQVLYRPRNGTGRCARATELIAVKR